MNASRVSISEEFYRYRYWYSWYWVSITNILSRARHRGHAKLTARHRAVKLLEQGNWNKFKIPGTATAKSALCDRYIPPDLDRNNISADMLALILRELHISPDRYWWSDLLIPYISFAMIWHYRLILICQPLMPALMGYFVCMANT